MSGPKILLTGVPGCGKTTLVKAVVREVSPVRVVGFMTEEIREGGERLGFRATLWPGPGETILAHVQSGSRHRVGRYGVEVEAFEELVLPSLEGEVDPGSLYLLDEIGKMECLSKRFQRAVVHILDSRAAVLATIPLRATGFILEIKSRPGIRTCNLRPSNRQETQKKIAGLLRRWVSGFLRKPAGAR